MRRLAVGLLCFTLSGCLIWPVSEVTYPQIDGQLLAAGSPARGVTLASCARGGAPRPKSVSSQTDSLGRFRFERQARRRYVTAIFGDPVYQVCIQAGPAGSELAWVRQSIGVFPEQLSLQCTMDAGALRCTDVR